MAKVLDFRSSLLASNLALVKTIFIFAKNAWRFPKLRGSQWESTLLKIFPGKLQWRGYSVTLNRACWETENSDTLSGGLN